MLEFFRYKKFYFIGIRLSMQNLANQKQFYDKQREFTARTLSEYNISPGTRAKFDIIKMYLQNKRFHSALDLGCSGNSVLHYLPRISKKFFLDLAHKPLINYILKPSYFPVMGTISKIPFPDKIFDLITALDVIEHIKDDKEVADEIARLLKPNGILLVTVPHKHKYYSYQDQIIGHYRRYEVEEIYDLFKKNNLKPIRTFGIYGQLMNAQMIQASNPEETENSINSLRNFYVNNAVFRRIWNKIVKFGAYCMKLDAKFQPLHKILNLGVIFKKKS